MKKYDLIVIGGGPGGYIAAIRGAQLGAKVALIEKNKVGGTCLNTGCIPTKALVKNADVINTVKKAKKRGIKTDITDIDFKKGIKVKNKAVKQLVSGVEGLLEANDIDVYSGVGIVDDRTITIRNNDNETNLKYDKLIIATGSSPVSIPFKGNAFSELLNNEDILSIEDMPNRLAIIGGGVIGCEMAYIFNSYGSKVTIIEKMDRLVSTLDPAISQILYDNLLDSGIKINLSSDIDQINKHDNEYTIKLNGEDLVSDKILVSVGRKPNTFGLENLKLNMNRGFVEVDNNLQTSCKDVYAIGDVTGKQMLAHLASSMGIRAAENALGKEREMDYKIIPSCIFTNPEIGCIGLTEQSAKDEGYDVLCGEFPFIASGKAIAAGDTEGLVRLVADKRNNEVLGGYIIGDNATELISEIAAYIKMGATLEDIGNTIHAHPTRSEAVFEAAHDALGHCLHLPPKN